MSDMKPKGKAIKLGRKEYRLLFTLNIIDDFQEKYDTPIQEMDKKLEDPKMQFKVLRFLIAQMINEYTQYAKDIDPDSEDAKQPEVTERWVGTMVNVHNMKDLRKTLIDAMADGVPQGDDDDPNPESGQ